jgi:NAD(P)-dependent dehydrogenase (short-subunit alcohol dehydrogenase family)
MTQDDIAHADHRPTVLLTGPTRGIGAEILRRLIEHRSRPRLVLLARDSRRLADAVGAATSAGLAATGIELDLADLHSVRAATDAVRAAVDGGGLRSPDVVLANAGAQFPDRRGVSAQGIERAFAVNVVAQHALLRGLEPVLAPDAHVVLMGSSTHRGRAKSFGLIPSPKETAPDILARPDQSDVGATRVAGGRAYAESKLALVTLAHEWARRLAASGRRLNTYDPGLVPGTGLGRSLPGYMRWTWEHVMPAMRVLPGATSPANTARHAVELAMGDAHADLHDGYVEIGRVTRAESRTFDRERQRELAAWLDHVVDARLGSPGSSAVAFPVGQ